MIRHSGYCLSSLALSPAICSCLIEGICSGISSCIFIHLLDLTRNSFEKCNFWPIDYNFSSDSREKNVTTIMEQLLWDKLETFII
jgi:hypothetical protein